MSESEHTDDDVGKTQSILSRMIYGMKKWKFDWIYDQNRSHE